MKVFLLGRIRSGRIGFKRTTNSFEIVLYRVVQHEIGLKSPIAEAPMNLGTRERMVAFADDGRKPVRKKCEIFWVMRGLHDPE